MNNCEKKGVKYDALEKCIEKSEKVKKCDKLTEYIYQIIRRNQDENFLHRLLIKIIVLEEELNK